MKLERIVVGVDLSQSSVKSLDWAGNALAPNAEVWALHCLEVPREGHVLWDSLPPRDELVGQLTTRAVERLRGMCPGRQIQHVVREGPPWRELPLLGEEIEADAIVVGEHEGPWSLRQVLGSTAEHLLAQTSIPVLSLRGRVNGAPRTILVEVDDSAESHRALEAGRLLAREHEARLVLHHVVSDWFRRRVREVASDQEAEDVQKRVEEGARKWLQGLWEKRGDGGEAHLVVSPGPVGFQALAAVDRHGADLVVVGTGGVRSVVGDPLKHVSRFLVLTAPCPVLAVPAEQEAT